MPRLLLSSADGLVSRRVLVPQHLSHLGVSSCTWSPFNRLLLLLFAPPPQAPADTGSNLKEALILSLDYCTKSVPSSD